MTGDYTEKFVHKYMCIMKYYLNSSLNVFIINFLHCLSILLAILWIVIGFGRANVAMRGTMLSLYLSCMAYI